MNKMFLNKKDRLYTLFTMTVLCILFCTVSYAAQPGDPALSAALSRVKMLADLTSAEKEALQSAAKLRRAQAGVCLTRKGAALDRMFIVLDGEAEVRVNGEFVTAPSGQFLVGEAEYLDQGPVFADVTLIKEADIIELNNDALTRLMESQPHIGYVIMREIARIEAKRLRATTTAGK